MNLFQQLNRVSLIFNLMFAACMVLRFLAINADGELIGILVVGGWLISFPCNLILAVWIILQLLRKQSNPVQIVAILNLLVLLFQMLYFIIL